MIFKLKMKGVGSALAMDNKKNQQNSVSLGSILDKPKVSERRKVVDRKSKAKES